MKINTKESFINFWQVKHITSKIKKILFILGRDAFLFILFVLLIEVIFAELLFYKYVLSVEIQEPSSLSSFVGFKENEYQSIIKEWNAREEFFKNYSSNNVSNPFQP